MRPGNFTLGAIAGIVAAALAVPFLAQISSAASTGTPNKRPVPTQQQVTDMAAKDAAFLSNIDALVAVEKSAVQAHQTALTAAAAITDDTQRAAAVKAANDAERTAIDAAIAANANLKSAMMRFGGGLRGPGGPGMMGRGPDAEDIATKLGMTETELKAALDGGKTIQELATEKGITLPAMNGKGKRGRGWMMGGFKKASSSTSSTSSAE